MSVKRWEKVGSGNWELGIGNWELGIDDDESYKSYHTSCTRTAIGKLIFKERIPIAKGVIELLNFKFKTGSLAPDVSSVK